MSFLHRHLRLLIVAICSVAVGAAASAIAVAGAAAGSSQSSAAHPRLRAARGLAKRAVAGSFVVRTKAGYRTVRVERGVVDSVSGRQLTLTEGTRTDAYRTVTETIPTTARIRDDRAKATLSALKPGQRVLVVQAPKRTFVRAHTARPSGASAGSSAG